jgi:hypothetical protein
MQEQRTGPRLVEAPPKPSNGDKRKWTGQKWEYRQECVTQMDLVNIPNVVGEEGWELCGFVPAPVKMSALAQEVPGAVMIFKRPK